MKLGWIGFSFCLGLGLVVAPVQAELLLDTQQITLATKRTKSVQKSLRLTATEAIEPPLQITASDLELADGSARIPAQAIAITHPEEPLAANQTQTLQIQLDGAALNASGEFTGNLLIQSEGSRQTLPIVLQVKSHAGFAWLTLLAGAGLGTALTLYRTMGLPKDELLVRVGKLRTQMQGETESAAERFQAAAAGELVAVETALGNRDWESAETHLKAAQTVWTRWLSGKPDWIVQIAYLKNLLQEVSRVNVNREAMTAQINGIQRQLAERESPQALAEQVSVVRAQLARYKRGEGWLTKLFDLSTQLTDPVKKHRWTIERETLEEALGELAPDDEAAFEGWLVEIKAACQQVSEAIAQQPSETGMESARRAVAVGAQNVALEPIPAVSAHGKQSSPQYAQQNIRVFQFVSQGMAIALMAWLGMAEMYEPEKTFGAQPISNYFGLFAWGFGAEVSRDTIVKALGDLRSPLSEKKKEE